jgi:hypothetical protein
MLFFFCVVAGSEEKSYSERRILSLSSTPAEETKEVTEEGKSDGIQYFLFIQEWGGNFKRYVIIEVIALQ